MACVMYYQGDACAENLDMSGILTAVSEMSEILLREVSGNISCPGKVA